MLKGISIIMNRCGLVTGASLLALVITSGSSMAATTVDVNGILETDEYTGTDSGSFEASFINEHEHETIYTGSETTTVYWEEEGDYLYLFMEAPIYAKNMIWGEDVTDADILLYQDQYNNHHNPLNHYQPGDAGCEDKDGSCKDSLDYKRATHSEGVEFEDYGKFGLQDSGSFDGGDIYMETSLKWLVDNTSCTDGILGDCNARNTTMSFEFMMLLSSLTGGNSVALLDELENGDGIGFHLSPEMAGTQVVPVPAAFWLFGTALVGLIGMRRKTKLTA